MTELYSSTVKILAPRPTHISAVATVLLITKTFRVKYDRRLQTNTTSIIIIIIITTTTIISHIKRDSECNGNEPPPKKKNKKKVKNIWS